jgi:hypothetical protein
VASAVGGMLDTVVDSVTGALVPPRDPAALAEVISTLLASPSQRAEFARAGPRAYAGAIRGIRLPLIPQPSTSNPPDAWAWTTQPGGGCKSPYECLPRSCRGNARLAVWHQKKREEGRHAGPRH